MPNYPDELPIPPWAGPPPVGRVRVPGSKSLTNRALIVAALAEGESVLTGALDSDDTRVMVDALQKLGIAVAHDVAGATIRVPGCGGRVPATEAELYVANSGTSLRFLTALVCAGQGAYRLDGTPRMRQRPVRAAALSAIMTGVRVTEASVVFPARSPARIVQVPVVPKVVDAAHGVPATPRSISDGLISATERSPTASLTDQYRRT